MCMAIEHYAIYNLKMGQAVNETTTFQHYMTFALTSTINQKIS
jgi:hypothetical protein